MSATKAVNPDDDVRMTIKDVKYADYQVYLESVKESGMTRNDYFKLIYDTAHQTFEIIKDKNNLLKNLANINKELHRRERKRLHILRYKFGIILSDSEKILDEMLADIEEPFE